jgi:tripartite-type tricarboxylate transporter receptor subunit TctC
MGSWLHSCEGGHCIGGNRPTIILRGRGIAVFESIVFEFDSIVHNPPIQDNERRSRKQTEIMMKRLLLCAVALLLGAASAAQARGYPNGPINLVTPYASGDATDLAARTMATELSKLLKVPVLVINRPGAGGAMGTEYVAKAAKDGYTILFTTNATLTFRRVFDPATAHYDSLRDFVPLGLSTRAPNVLALRSDLPYKDLAGMVAFAKKNPGQVRIGTAGAGTAGDFTVATVNELTGADLTMVPFKGASPAVTDVLGGHIEGVTVALGVVSSHMRSGALKAIAISSRVPEFPDVPTLADQGYSKNIFGLWLGFFAPAGVPAEVTTVLVPAIEKVVKDPGISALLLPRGLVQEYVSPSLVLNEMMEEFRRIEELAKKSAVVK